MKTAASRESAARRYRIEKYLTEGGMGAIYLGKKMGSGGFQKEVVLKQLLPEYTARPEFRDLFFREAKISATLDHANIVHTFDLVESDQSLFIVMEYVRGADLRTILRRARQRHRELSPAAAIHIALEILAGLSYAHTRRDRRGVSLDIIHRDVSPSNIICSAQGEAKLSDFGIAKASTHSSVFYRVRGKVGYMSPEQARSQPIDRRCDIYSLAVCLYESLSGERLFVGDLSTPADEIYGHPIPPISQKRPGLPTALDEVLAKALAPDIADRHQTAGQLSDALRNVAHKTGLAISAPELASHLREILGDNPERWLRDDATSAAAEPQKIPPASIGLVGKEAASIGIVAGPPEDVDPRLVLSPRPVSGSKDFDIDSMLSDEATRPGNVVGPGSGPVPRNEAVTPRPLGASRPGSPPPVWTRSSGPIPIVTPPPERQAAPQTRARLGPPPMAGAPAPAMRAPATAPAARAPAPPSAPAAARATAPVAVRASAPALAVAAAPQPPPVPPPNRSPSRATQRGMAVPPPVPPAPPPRTVALPPPPPPPLPAAPVAVRGRSPFGQEFEEATPPPPAAVPHVGSFDIEEAPAASHSRWPAGPLPVPGRSRPPAGYPLPAVGSAAAAAAAAAEAVPAFAPLHLSRPETVDLSGSAMLPEKKSGPPRWLVFVGLAVGLVGGGVLAQRVTRDQVGRLVASAEQPRPHREASPAPAELPPPEEAAPPAAPTGDRPRQPNSLGLSAVEAKPRGAAGSARGPAVGRPHAPKPGATKRRAPAAHKKPAVRRH